MTGTIVYLIAMALMHCALIWLMARNCDHALVSRQRGWAITFGALLGLNALCLLHVLARLFLLEVR